MKIVQTRNGIYNKVVFPKFSAIYPKANRYFCRGLSMSQVLNFEAHNSEFDSHCHC